MSVDKYPKVDDEKEFMSKNPYQFVVDSLMYAMIATRLDIAFVVGATSKFFFKL